MKFRKPNSICFEIMQRRLGVPYEKMVYVGDNSVNGGADVIGIATHVQ